MMKASDLQGKTKAELLAELLLQEEKHQQKTSQLTSHFQTKLKAKTQRVTQLEERTAQLENRTEKLKEHAAQLEDRTEKLEELVRYLKQAKFGRSSERYIDTDLQGCLFDEADLTPVEQEEAEEADREVSIAAHTRKPNKGGRKKLPEHLGREQVIHDLSDEEKHCACGCELSLIGEERTEQLEIIPVQMYVIEHIQKKYACKGCENTIKSAKKPKQPIAQSIAGPGLLAHVLTEKFQFHLPLYRQEQRLQRIGVDLPRATLSHWVIKSGKLLQPLVNLLEDEILSYDVAYADETTVQVLKEPNKRAQSESYLWAYGGGPPERFSQVFHYHPNRKHEHAVEFFNSFAGYLHCDGYQAYDALCRTNPKVTQVGCWYHARRKFTDAAKASKKAGFATWVIKEIQRLSKIERAIQEQNLTPAAAKDYRQLKAPAILEKLKAKLLEAKHTTPANGKLGKAISYTLNQWPKLLTYLADGRLEISNNRMERAIKPFAVGRKNWMFANSVKGVEAAAVIFSLMETCKLHNVNPYDWLRLALAKLPLCETVEDFEALLPFNFRNHKFSY